MTDPVVDPNVASDLLNGEMGIPGHLPEKTIGIGKISSVPAPACFLRRLDDFRARCAHLLDKLVYFLGT